MSEEKKKKESPFKDKKKEFKITPSVDHNGLYNIKLEGGGQMPKALSGLYTSVDDAMKDIELYQFQLNKREK